jgi:hypothetical protein
MNPGPVLIIRKTFPTLLLAFLFLTLMKSENTKITFTFCSYTQNTKAALLYRISFSLLYIIYFFLLFYLLYLFRNLVLDNHSVELGTQDKELVLQVA